MNIGEWKMIEIGGSTAIGYVSSIKNHSWHKECVEFTKVGWITNNTIQWRKPTQGIYESSRFHSAAQLLDFYQDKTALIDLALLTRDKEWFDELTVDIF
ncbi:IDEAL domain-containing protein [Domibacillus sp. PGB-M46]|uniref:IDEAL domain-containing protein n=1 Tax=Domibacillus sp. PGB-M46 TaxID=2910255 RepID=UPI001F59DA35|nr:IDEAL domain-containing protein [Domibacillus sp. PGB-M46]MCI2254128.1 IDEAL domain-containing protein [Domibacillus sp. PGB-M46]